MATKPYLKELGDCKAVSADQAGDKPPKLAALQPVEARMEMAQDTEDKSVPLTFTPHDIQGLLEDMLPHSRSLYECVLDSLEDADNHKNWKEKLTKAMGSSLTAQDLKLVTREFAEAVGQQKTQVTIPVNNRQIHIKLQIDYPDLSELGRLKYVPPEQD